jgi:hypothetical protein
MDKEERPMTPGERQALSRIIKNTFETLMSELETLRLNAIADAEREFNERVMETSGRRSELVAKATEEAIRINAEFKKIEEEIRAEGFDVEWDNYYRPSYRNSAVVKVTDKHHRLLMEQRKRDIDNQYRKAVEILRRKKLDADKDLLLTAIKTEEAKAFMDSLPSATSLFALALEA